MQHLSHHRAGRRLACPLSAPHIGKRIWIHPRDGRFAIQYRRYLKVLVVSV